MATGIKGPIFINGQAHGALLLGRSSSGLKGLFVLPGVIDCDFTGEICIVVQTFFPPIHVPKGSRIAQLVPVQQLVQQMTAESRQFRGTGGFGSTGALALLTVPMNQRPLARVTLLHGTDKKCLSALLDTGADITIIATNQWPNHWPLQDTVGGVAGVGGTASVQRSQQRVQIVIDGRVATLYVTVMPLPTGVNALIGRDVLNQLGAVLTTEPPF